jgi:adenylate cyclase, class 2
MPLEREIKLRFDSADEARVRVRALGATPLRARRLQQDTLLDTPDRQLSARQSALRVRQESGHSVLTFKGPPQPGAMKLRDEHETVVGNGPVLMTILHALGLDVCFRYEKYREEFAAGDAVIAIDETPVGVFVEIEGSETAIHRIAGGLGKSPADYITASYRTLFVAHRAGTGVPGEHMVFPDSTRA